MAGLHPEKVVVPLDFSDLAWQAVERAVEIAGDPTRVHVVHVLAPLSTMEPGVVYGTITDESRTRHSGKRLREKLHERGFGDVVSHVMIGNAGRQIAAYAEHEKADLIVIPSHGRGFVRNLLLGSVAERVVRLAHCPVLVLRQ